MNWLHRNNAVKTFRPVKNHNKNNQAFCSDSLKKYSDQNRLVTYQWLEYIALWRLFHKNEIRYSKVDTEIQEHVVDLH